MEEELKRARAMLAQSQEAYEAAKSIVSMNGLKPEVIEKYTAKMRVMEILVRHYRRRANRLEKLVNAM